MISRLTGGEYTDPYLDEKELAECKEKGYLYRLLATKRSLGAERYGKVLEVFLARLHAEDPRIQMQAMRFLGYTLRAPEAADKVLQVATASESSSLRLAAAESLGWVGDVRAVEILAPYLRGVDDRLTMRAAAIWTDILGLKQPLSVAVAVRLLLSDNPRVVHEAAFELSTWLSRKLLEGTAEERARVIDIATSVAAEAPEKTAVRTVSALEDARAYFESDEQVDRCIERIWTRYERASPHLKCTMLRMEAVLRPQRCLDHLLAALQDENERVLVIAAREIGLLRKAGAPAIPRLAELLDHKNDRIRRDAALSILRIEAGIKKAPPADVVVRLARDVLSEMKGQVETQAGASPTRPTDPADSGDSHQFQNGQDRAVSDD